MFGPHSCARCRISYLMVWYFLNIVDCIVIEMFLYLSLIAGKWVRSPRLITPTATGCFTTTPGKMFGALFCVL